MKIYFTNQFRKNDEQTSSHRLLQRVLTEYRGFPGDVQVVRPAGGKPYVRMPGAKAFGFSVTHTGTFWLCAVGEYAVGIDAEMQDRRVVSPDRMADRYFEPEEADLIRGTADPDEKRLQMLRLWTRKEALLKYTGAGLAEVSSSGSVLEHGGVGIMTFEKDPLVVSVCVPEGSEAEPVWICMDEDI